MSDTLLSICIPTRNRERYLRDSLTALVTQAAAVDPNAEAVHFHVSDNVSTDGTPVVVEECRKIFPRLTYGRNETNVGADGNVIVCVRKSVGRFTWVYGDDDLLHPGGLATVLQTLRSTPASGLVIAFRTSFRLRIPRPRTFGSFADYARACATCHPHALIEHTLCTSNVFRTDCFDLDFAAQMLPTNYSHMYAVVKGLLDRGGKVVLPAAPVIEIRDRRAPAVDGDWPPDLERSWRGYLGWIREHHRVPELDPEAAIAELRADFLGQVRRHPLRYVINNLHALKHPKSWAFAARRFWGHLRGR